MYSLGDFYELKSIVRRSQYESFNHQHPISRNFHLFTLLLNYGLRFFFKSIFKKMYLLFEFSEAQKKSNYIDKSIKALPFEYQVWLSKNSPTSSDLKKIKEDIIFFSNKPLISILMPVYNTPEKYLREAIDSVMSQVYKNWELCIADDNSSNANVKRVLDEYVQKDSRIKVVYRHQNGHISASSNTTIEMAKGEYVSLFDHDDLLTPDALYYVVRYINLYPKAELIYTDEDKIDDNGCFLEPYFKPDWSPETLLSRNYITHFATVKTDLIKLVGGFRLGYEGSQDYDLFLRLTEKAKHIYHIPRVLYHWRIHQMSTSNNAAAKPYAFDAGVKSLQDAIDRRNLNGVASKIEGMPGHYSVSLSILNEAKISILLCAQKSIRETKKCIDSILNASTYLNFELIIIHPKELGNELSVLLSTYKLDIKTDLLDEDNNPKSINKATKLAAGSILVFMNDLVEIITPNWLELMMQHAQLESVGMVGVKVLFFEKYILSAGIVVGLNGMYGHPFQGLPASNSGHFGQVASLNNYSAVSGICMMCKKQDFESIGGFDENFTQNHYDVDLCLRLKEKGLSIVYQPDAIVNNNFMRKKRSSVEDRLFSLNWGESIENDTMYNANLTKEWSDYSIAI